ncbi:aminopeptidase N-like [Penaeus indicus]|uniref:aminopeptidase N-like n=1 Tax=Penaeus indicus TaxID=29960 RepID=UPI00300CA789
MRGGHPDQTVSFGRKRGCYMTRCGSVLLATLFVGGLVATGVLVFRYGQDLRHFFGDTSIESDVEIISSSRRGKSLEKIVAPSGSTLHTKKELSEIEHNELRPLPAETHTTTTTTMSPTTTTTTTTTTAPTTTTEAPAKEKLLARLPRALNPLHYLVKLQPLINGNFSILGYVEVEMEVLEPTSNITLHMADIITKNETITLKPSGELAGPGVGIKMHQYDPERQFYIAHLEKQLEKGETYVLSMGFLGYLNDQLHGFYRSTYRDDDGTNKLLAVTQFQASDARRAFPCFDEPGFKATFEVFLAREENMVTISNMPLAETLPLIGQEGWVWDRYERSVPMSTYLVAFVVSDFVNWNSTVIDHVLFRVWARERAIEQAEYARDIGPRILRHFENYFNLSFPLPKMDMIALPDFAPGAMENWGLVTYRETLMLYDPAASSAFNKQLVAQVVGHEIAHQWFGNLVTPKWWTDIWLNEGFASYVEYIGVDHVEPEWKVLEQFVVRRIHDVFTVDSLESSHPIRHNALNADRIAYDKGSSIIRMMSNFLNENTFRRGLNKYLQSLTYDNAESDDLWRHLTVAAHEDGTLPQDVTVKMIMDTWTLQKGYPVIKVERSADGTSATVSQERFLLVRDENSSDTHDYKWWVPLTYTTQSEANFNQTQAMVWMKDAEDQISLSSLPPKDQWVIFNLQETGYYRVNYDDHNWGLLIQQLKTDHQVINPINRAQIIDDAMDLARADQLPYETALGILTYLEAESDYIPWWAALNNVVYLKDMLARTGGYGALKNYLLDILIPLYESVGFEENPDDGLLDRYKRAKAVVWACALGHQHCLDSASALYHAWMANPDNLTLISPNLKSTVYCYAIAEGGEAEWDFAWHQYLKSNVGSEKEKLLSALGCSKEMWLLSRYLDMAFTDGSGIRKQDSSRVFGAIASNEVGLPLAWAYLQDNFDKIFSFFDKIMVRLIRSTTQKVNTRQELMELTALQTRHAKQLEPVALEVEQIVEGVQNNIAWLEANYNTIIMWLEKIGYSTKLRTI